MQPNAVEFSATDWRMIFPEPHICQCDSQISLTCKTCPTLNNLFSDLQVYLSIGPRISLKIHFVDMVTHSNALRILKMVNRRTQSETIRFFEDSLST